MQGTLCVTRDGLWLQLRAACVFLDASEDAVIRLRTPEGSPIEIRALPREVQGQDILLVLPRPPGFLPTGPDGDGITARVSQHDKDLAVQLEVHMVDDLAGQTGHVAGLDPDGQLFGWTTAEAAPGSELPLWLEIDGQRVPCLSRGTWFQTGLRRWSAVLPRTTGQGRMVPVRVTGAQGGAAFNRSPLFVGQVEQDWIVAAPLRRDEEILSGAALVPAARTQPLTVEMEDSQGRLGAPVPCTNPAMDEYNFSNVHCGFSLDLAPDFDLERSRLVFRHPRFSRAFRVPIAELWP